MEKQTVLILGAGSDIAAETKHLLEKNYQVIALTRQDLDLQDPGAASTISKMLHSVQPDVVINTAGIFGHNDVDFHSTMTVNLGSNWWVIKHYLDHPPQKVVKFIMLGSSTYKQGRKKYVLYAASKAALYNMWQGASEALEHTKVLLALINPVRVDTKMVRHLKTADQNNYLSAADVAVEIMRTIENISCSRSIDIDYDHKSRW